MIKRLYISGIAFLFTFWSFGQASIIDLSISKDTITIGESIDVMIKVYQQVNVPGGRLEFDLSTIENLAYEQDTNALEEYADVALINEGNLSQYILGDKIKIPLDQVNQKNLPWQESITLGVYSIGAFHIKAPVIYSLQGDSMSSGGGGILFVNPPEGFGQDSTKVINELKPIIEVESSWQDYLIYIYWLLGLLVAFFVGRFVIKRLQTVPELEEKPEPEVEILKEPAHIIALRALNQLKDNQQWKQGEIKEYQSNLTTTIRQYLEDRYTINALEMTTNEITAAIQKESSMQGQVDTLKNILTVADMVKFAKAKPSEDIHEMFLTQAFEFVNKTKSSENVE